MSQPPVESKPCKTLLAFDLDSGEFVWAGGDEMIAYGSPILAEVGGRRQILMTAETKAMGFNPLDGSVLWTHDRDGNTGGKTNTSQVTVVDANHVLTSKGYQEGGELIKLIPTATGFDTESVWSNNRVLNTKLTSPVVKDGHTYCLSDGFLECTRIEDGERQWKRRGRFGHGQLLLVGDYLLLHTESGQLILVDASPDEFFEHGRIKSINGVCWNTIALTGNRVLVRSEIEAACIEIPVLD